MWIVAQLDLGLIHNRTVESVVGQNVRRCFARLNQVGQARALLADRVGQAVGVQHDVRGGHEQAVDSRVDLDGIVCDIGILIHDVLTKQRDDARHIGTSHGGTGQTVVAAARNGRQNVTAVRRDLGLDAEVGGGGPKTRSQT